MARSWSLRRACPVLLALGLVIVAGSAAAQTPGPEDGGPAADVEAGTGERAGPRVPYEVVIEGDLTDSMRELLLEVSEARRLTDRPPPSIARLRRRGQDDVAGLLRALRSRAYYAATVEVRLEAAEEPARLIFAVDTGPEYRLRRIEIELEPPESEFRLPAPEELGLAEGLRAGAQRILDAETRLLEVAREEGFALAELGQRRAVVDHDADAMDLTLRLQPGPRSRFGPIEIAGLDSVEEGFVRRRLPWEAGETITPERIEAGRRALLDAGLFSTVRIRLGRTVDDSGALPVTIELEEGAHRSIEVGARFRSDEGPGGNVGWEHRNLFGAGERLGVGFDASGIGYLAEGDFRKPDFILRDQALLVGSHLALEDTDAFESRSIGASVGVERILAPGTTAELGLALRLVEIDDEGGTEDDESFGLLSVPARIALDRSDDLLDPSEGGRFSVANEPFVDVLGSGVMFNKTLVRYTHYLQVLDEPRLVLAGRTALGTIFGAERNAVPADERFYAGGGGSVRGFGFQLAGELDEDDDPRGGRSLLELSGEVRLRLTESIGAVVFADAGSAFETQFPDFSEDLRIGVGTGLRYFSPIGPLRFDVAFPLNRRDVDDAFQFYISVGQAF